MNYYYVILDGLNGNQECIQLDFNKLQKTVAGSIVCNLSMKLLSNII